MNYINPINRTNLLGLDRFITELVYMYDNGCLPNQILLSGLKGSGKSTLAYHLINYVLSKNEEFSYDVNNFLINTENKSFQTIVNKSNPNITIIDKNVEKKIIDINQIRELINNLNKSSFNDKPRFVLIDNIEFLNVSSINALLKVLEEPNFNIYFILINNNKKILHTLTSRCINFKISLNNKENLKIANSLLDGNLYQFINNDLINYYFTPGNIYNLAKFGEKNNYNLFDLDLKDLIKILIKENYYKKDTFIRYIIFDLIEFYFRKINFSLSSKVYEKYSYFLKRISCTKKYYLDEESLFDEFEEEILNG